MPVSEVRNPAETMPRVSVVMPVYNAVSFLPVSIGSVLEQTMTDWELVLVDDGSSDGSLAVCEGYTCADHRIRVVAQENRGPSAARNSGVHTARGDFIFFLDADDRLPSDALELLLSAAEAGQADMALGNFLKQENDAPPVSQPAILALGDEPFHGEAKVLAEGELIQYLRHFLHYPSNHLVSYCWARLYRRSLIVEFALCADENMRLFEDFAFNLAFLGKARRLVFVNRPVYIYVLRSGHASASMSILNAARLTADMQAFRQVVDDFMAQIGVAAELATTVREEVGHALVHYALIFIIRTCRQIGPDNRAAILRELRRFLSSSVLRDSLPFYTPRPGNSRLLPVLIKLKLVRLLAVIAESRGNRRYGKLKNGKA